MSEERRRYQRRRDDDTFRVVDEEPAQRDMRDIGTFRPGDKVPGVSYAARNETYPFPPAVGAGVDPWKHRSSGMRCATCMWFVPKVPDKVKFPLMETQPYDLGRCRRHAPTMNGYPTVFVNDWCGDHKLDENKL